MAKEKRAHTLWPHLACGLGGAFNAFRRHMNASFCLIFYMNVIGFTSGQAGLIRATGLITSLVSTLLFGYLCDKLDVLYLSRRLGRRKTWHLLTSALLALFFIMDYMRCFLCSGSAWSLLAYYLITQGAASFMYSACELTHLSIIPTIAKTQDEAIILNTIRQGLTYITGILTYAVAWAILGQSSQKKLSPGDWYNFVFITTALVVTGLVCVTVFQIGTREPRFNKSRKVSTIVGTAGLLSVSVVFGLTAPEEQKKESKAEERKPSILRKMSEYIMPFDVGPERWEPENRRESRSERKTSFWQRLPGLGRNNEENHRKESRENTGEGKTLPKSDTGERQSQTESAGGTFSADVEVFVSKEEQTDRAGVSQANLKKENLLFLERFVSQDEHNTDHTGVSQEASGKKKQRKRGVYRRDEPYVDPNCEDIVTSGDEVTDDHTHDTKKLPFHQQLEYSDDITDDVQKTEEHGSTKNGKDHKESELGEIIDACHVHRENVKVVKTWRSWLKDAGLYKASCNYIAVRLTENLTYSYLALYLTEYLRFEKQAIAYFPLILFVSSLFGTAVAKKLKETFGHKCTFCISAAGVIGGALWFYFLTQDTRNMVYAPVVLLGFGLSAQSIMSLAFVTQVIGKDKESSGFVYSVMTAGNKIVTAAYYLIAQTFYPTDIEDRSNFVRHLLPISQVTLTCLLCTLILVTGTKQPDVTDEPKESSPQAPQEQA